MHTLSVIINASVAAEGMQAFVLIIRDTTVVLMDVEIAKHMQTMLPSQQLIHGLETYPFIRRGVCRFWERGVNARRWPYFY